MKQVKRKLRREVVANRTIEDLVKGEKYIVDRVSVGATKTEYLINGHEYYNSVWFDEVYYSPLMQALSLVKEGNEPRVIARLSEPKDINFVLGEGVGVTVEVTTDMLKEMSIFGTLTIGRNQQCNIKRVVYKDMSLPFSSEVSRMHVIIYRENENSWRVIDCSSFGTEVLL